MIPVAEVAEIAGLKGVPESQIWRDWVVSHLLQALGEIQQETNVVFYGDARPPTARSATEP